MTIQTIITLLFSSLRLGSIVALAALGIVLIFRTSKATNFAQGTIGTLNAYIAAYVMTTLGYSFLISLIVAMITAFLTGVIIDKVFIRPAHKANPVSKQILTLGIIMILVGIMNSSIGLLGKVFPLTVDFPQPFIPSSERISIFGASIELNTIFIFSITLIILVLSFLFIQKTRWGLATRVTASNEQTAQLMGVPTKTITMFSWAIAAMMGSLAGIFLAPRVGLSPTMMISVQISAFFAGVFGGFATFHGPVIAAYLIGFLLNISGYYMISVLRQDAIFAEIFVYLLILVILFFRPFGLFGKKPIRKV